MNNITISLIADYILTKLYVNFKVKQKKLAKTNYSAKNKKNTVSIDKEIEFEPDMVVVAYGTNDWNCCTEKEFIHNCKEFLYNLP